MNPPNLNMAIALAGRHPTGPLPPTPRGRGLQGVARPLAPQGRLQLRAVVVQPVVETCRPAVEVQLYLIVYHLILWR